MDKMCSDLRKNVSSIYFKNKSKNSASSERILGKNNLSYEYYRKSNYQVDRKILRKWPPLYLRSWRDINRGCKVDQTFFFIL